MAAVRRKAPAKRPAAGKAGKQGSAKDYAALLSTYGKRTYWKKAIGALDEMRDKQLGLDTLSYSLVVGSMAKSQRWERALQLLQEAREEEMADAAVYGAAVSACEWGEQWEGALGLLREMQDGRLSPEASAWNAAIGAAGAGEQWQWALELLGQMPEPEEASYAAAIPACGLAGAWKQALRLADEMRAQGLEPDLQSYGALLTECERQSSPAREREGSLLGRAGQAAARPSGGRKDQGRGKDLRSAAADAAAKQRGTQARGGRGAPVPHDFLPIASAIGNIPSGAPYSKELRLLQHVLRRARRDDPVSVYKTIENYGKDVLGGTGRWLKVAGDAKAEILTATVRGADPGGHVLEIGAYCGYSATRMSISVPDAKIASLEVDPVHVIIARNVLMYGGLQGYVDVWTGHSKDLIPRIEGRYGGPGQLHFSAVFMDQKGSLYERDLAALQEQGLLRPTAVVVADNVLKPGAPLFLRQIMLGGSYQSQLVTVQEFAMPSEDWMSLCVSKPSTGVMKPTVAETRPGEEPQFEDLPPDDPLQELLTLNWEADRMRERATGPGRSVTFEEWAEFAEKMRQRCAAHDICVTSQATMPRPRYERRK